MGVSDQTGLPSDLNKSLLWTYEIQGGGVPVIAGEGLSIWLLWSGG